MAGFGQEPPGDLEGQLRRLILQSGSTPDSPGSQMISSNPARISHHSPSSSRYFGAHQNQSRAYNQQDSSSTHHAYGGTGSASARASQAPAHWEHPSTTPHATNHQSLQPRSGPSYQQSPGHPKSANNSNYPRGEAGNSRQARYAQMPLDPEAFHRADNSPNAPRHNPRARQLFQPNAGPSNASYAPRHVALGAQAAYLDQLVTTEVAPLKMSQAEHDQKIAFSQTLQNVCDEICKANPLRIPAVNLKCFGSFQSGFASAGSDMDLVITVKNQSLAAACYSLLEEDLPRALENELLQHGFGARLLTRTRVPIIKVCQQPGAELLKNLREERSKWDALPDEKKYPHLYPEEETGAEPQLETTESPQASQTSTREVSTASAGNGDIIINVPFPGGRMVFDDGRESSHDQNLHQPAEGPKTDQSQAPKTRREPSQAWTRERNAGPLDFPKTGVGIQSDINFSNSLGLHNTQMLRCYCLCDDRVQPMVLFIKAWAKRRKINSSYSGTLSSYGYVLMLLHYLVNVVKPAVLPNLQMPWRPNSNCSPHGATRAMVDDWEVNFWRAEDEILAAVRARQMTSNTSSVGSILAGFFQYYSSMGGPQFRWTQSVLSLRSPAGLLTKEEKGWTKAHTEEGEGRRIQHRYLFCIEDPFELSHNVARTVTHNGIVAIRDEFRRAYRILQTIGNGYTSHEGGLLDQLIEAESKRNSQQFSNAPNAPNALRARTPQPRADQSPKPAPKNHPREAKPTSPLPSKTALNMSDMSTFPTLGSTKPKSKPANKQDGSYSEISGDRAIAYLDEIKRKKAQSRSRG